MNFYKPNVQSTMNSKTTGYIFIFLVLLFFLALQSCNKYEDGPFFSVRSRTERVVNAWEVESYKINGIDYTSLTADYTETYSKDGNYSLTWGSLYGTGRWEFQNDDKEIKLIGINNISSKTLYILKLKEKEFWYYYMDGNDRNEFHMIEN